MRASPDQLVLLDVAPSAQGPARVPRPRRAIRGGPLTPLLPFMRPGPSVLEQVELLVATEPAPA
jgi:hypothetical protein